MKRLLLLLCLCPGLASAGTLYRCVSANGQVSLGFVTALQDQYTLKKTNNSASLGVGGVGSVSLPVMSSDEAMVKVGSETIASDRFYDSFFDLIQRYLVMGELPVQ